MKFLLLPMLLFGAGVGGYGLLGSEKDEIPAACASSECRVTVECTDRGTCLVTCYDENDDIVCQEEIACDEPCEKPCESKSSCTK
jgi:hypothetical protein